MSGFLRSGGTTSYAPSATDSDISLITRSPRPNSVVDILQNGAAANLVEKVVIRNQKTQHDLCTNDPMWKAAQNLDLQNLKKYASNVREFKAKDNRTALKGKRAEIERGAYGESILHLAVLYGANYDIKNEDQMRRNIEAIAWILLEFHEKLVAEKYRLSDYKDETALHLAVVNTKDGKLNFENITRIKTIRKESSKESMFTEIVNVLVTSKTQTGIVELLLAFDAKIDGTRFLGTAFKFEEPLPTLASNSKNQKSKNSGTSKVPKNRNEYYFGQTVLQYAVSAENWELARSFVEGQQKLAKEDFLGECDDFGNNVLHIMARNHDFDVKLFKELCEKNEGLKTTKNNSGATPFQSGILLGNPKILDVYKIPQWEFKKVLRFAMDVTDIDPIFKLNQNSNDERQLSALEIAVRNNQKLIIDHPVIDTLVRLKWNLYGRRVFLNRLIFTLIFMLVFTVTISFQPFDSSERKKYDFSDPNTRARCALEITSILFAVIMAVFEVLEIRVQGFKVYMRDLLSYEAENLTQWTFCILIFLIPAFRFIGSSADTVFEDIAFSLASMVGWCHLLSFAKGFEYLGPLVLIFWRIVFKDLIQWLFLYITITMGFTSAFFMLMRSSAASADPDTIASDPSIQDWGSFSGSIAWVVRFSLQQAQYDDFFTSAVPIVTKILFFTYAILVMIMMVNMLIAQLCDTFKQVVDDKKREWKLQLAALMIS
ncbi:Transient receptor putative cation channel sub V member 6 [Physocladia obscura]|uniref:Transient receptor putative cation channel sub V member 6 n=1 Tax=Physocladia obscura TaxID=109957 RepID=A0AAD5XC98_9FUNG|nr:Transient receptor putative cation channel sub V member 6 [Physocladia obscura]